MLCVLDQTNHRDGRRGEDRLDTVADLRLVVEADVTSRHWGGKLLTGFAHALDGADKLPVHFRIVGIAKIQAVGDGRGNSAGTDDVSGVFCHGNHGAHFRVGMNVAAIAIYGHGNGALGAFHVDNGCIARFVGRTIFGSDHGVVLVVYPVLGSNVWQANQLFRHRKKVLWAWYEVHVKVLVFGVVRRFTGFSMVDGSTATKHKRLSWDFGQLFSVPEVAHVGPFCDDSDRLTVDVPFLKNGFHLCLTAFVDDHEHALLRFRQQNLPGLHAVLTCRNFVEVDVHAHATAGRHFAC